MTKGIKTASQTPLKKSLLTFLANGCDTKVSEKRQITIPIDFYRALRLEDEVDCQLHGDAIVIRPVQEHSGEFDEQILAELAAEGKAEYLTYENIFEPADNNE